jgi:hypothetical protein
VLNVFNLLQWCFDRLSPARSSQSGVNVSPRMAVLDQGFIGPGVITCRVTRELLGGNCTRESNPQLIFDPAVTCTEKFTEGIGTSL